MGGCEWAMLLALSVLWGGSFFFNSVALRVLPPFTLLPIMLAADRPWQLPMPGPAVWGAVLGVGLLSSALANVLYFRILAAAGATNLLLVTFLIPASAILLGVAFLGAGVSAT